MANHSIQSSRKYDWNKLQGQWELDERNDLTGFLISKGIIEKGGKLKGYAARKVAELKFLEKKAAFKLAQSEAARQALINDPDIKDLSIRLQKNKQKILDHIELRIENLGDVEIRDIKILLEIVKTELGEPSTISKSENKNTDDGQQRLADALMRLAKAKENANTRS